MPLHGEALRPPLAKPVSRAAEKKAANRDKDTAWQAVRKAVLVRDGYRCRCCGTADKVDVHHMRFRSAGGSDSRNNTLVMCRCCHLELHAYRLHIAGADADTRVKFVRT